MILREKLFTYQLLPFDNFCPMLLRRLKSAFKSRIPPTLHRYYADVRKPRSFLDSFVSPMLIRREIERIARTSTPVIAGPWLSEVGFEVLYWIPFLNWARTRFNLSKDRITVISRGGNALWYREICSQYIDIFDYFTPEEFKNRNIARVVQGGLQKQMGIDTFDREIIASIKPSIGTNNFSLLHPSMMYRFFMPYWSQRRRIDLVLNHTKFQKSPRADSRAVYQALPAEYAAVKFYFSDCFPATDVNRKFVRDFVQRLATKMPVVVLDTGLDIDDHVDWTGDNNSRIHSVRELINARNNLHVQTMIVSQARAFFGTYGGFSYLAPFYGVRTMSFYSRKDFLPQHLDVARRAFSALEHSSFAVLDVKDADLAGLFSDYGETPHDY